jgi:glycosyltransferase involved in cell wall biosynthesis
MLRDRGHEVIHYGVAGSEPEGAEQVEVVSKETFDRVYGSFDWRNSMFDVGRDNDAYKEFEKRSIEELGRRAKPGEFLLCPFGWNHKFIADAHPELMAVETGIGYGFTWSKYRVFESYAWLHYHWGKEDKESCPNSYDVVIPNYCDLDDYTYRDKKEDYFLWLGRPIPNKGLRIAYDVCKRLGYRLVAAGQGSLPEDMDIQHLGVLGIEERNKWLGGARALFAPTLYVEPFGTVTIEAALCGTPTITTDFGAFTENVLHGITGYRCRTFEHFMWATQNIDNIDPADCRRFAEENFSLERVGGMYGEYLQMLSDLQRPEGWYATRERTRLDWLHKKYVPF